MKEAVIALVTPLLKKPEAMVLRDEGSEDLPKFVLEVDPSDIGRVIGREGRVIKAIRSMLAVAASAARVEEPRLDVNERPA